MTPDQARALLADRRRELRRYYTDTPPPDEDIGDCPVCDRAVFSDYTRRHADAWFAPVDMPDGGVTHQGCKHRYYAAVDEHARIQAYVPSLADLLDADDERDLFGTGVSAQSMRVEGEWLRDPARREELTK